MLSILLVATLGAGPAKLASTAFTCEGLTPAVCDAYLERFVSRLAAGGVVKVSTQKDIADVLGLERQRQLLGCDDEGSSCLAELASALGVDGIFNGTIARTSIGYLVSFKVVRASDASRWLTASRTAADEAELQRVLDATADDFRHQLGGAPPFTRALPWLTFGVGAAAAVGGAVAFGFSKADAALLKGTVPQPPAEVSATASRGATLQALGVTLFSIGLALAVAGLIWGLLQ